MKYLNVFSAEKSLFYKNNLVSTHIPNFRINIQNISTLHRARRERERDESVQRFDQYLPHFNQQPPVPLPRPINKNQVPSRRLKRVMFSKVKDSLKHNVTAAIFVQCQYLLLRGGLEDLWQTGH